MAWMMVQLLACRDLWWMTECEATLLADDVDVTLHPDPEQPGVYVLAVAGPDAERAGDVLAAAFAEEFARYREPPTHEAGVPLLWRPAFAAAFGLAALLLTFHAITGDLSADSMWHQRGALVRAAIASGELWRLVTAATLHADTVHALGNAAFCIFLGWAAAERLGAGAALFTWLSCAVVGFGASLQFSDAQLSVGASGGLFGLLSAAAGHALRHVGPGHAPRRRRLQVWSAAVLFLAFTGFSPHADWVAHLGGFVSGLCIGLSAPAAPLGSGSQALLGGGTVAAVVYGWWRVLGGG